MSKNTRDERGINDYDGRENGKRLWEHMLGVLLVIENWNSSHGGKNDEKEKRKREI